MPQDNPPLGRAHRTGCFDVLLFAEREYLPPDQAVEGNELAVEYFGELYPVTVAVAGSRPLFDPENARIRS